MARGELIAILEGEDYWPQDKLQVFVPAFQDDEVELAFGKTAVATPTGEAIGWSIPERKFLQQSGIAPRYNDPVGAATKAMLPWPGITYTFPCSPVIRRSALDAVAGFQRAPGLPFVDYSTSLAPNLRGRLFYTPQVMACWGGTAARPPSCGKPDERPAAIVRASLKLLGRAPRGEMDGGVPEDREPLRPWADRVTVVELQRNLGFAGGYNAGIREALRDLAVG